MQNEQPIVSVKNFGVEFPSGGGRFTAVNNISFDINKGEVVAIVDESGSGNSVTGLSIIQLLSEASGASMEGSIVLNIDGQSTEVTTAKKNVMSTIRGKHVSMIFQEPLTSLNPVYTVGNQVAEAVMLHQGLHRKAANERALEMFDRVRIPEAARRLKEYPHQMSGGMRQRVMIAMALSCDPTVLIADEPTTALDVTIQAQILGLMRQLQDETDAAVMIITHDMGVVAEVADDVVVMNRSKLVESGSVFDIFERPQEPYTQALLASVPKLGSMAGTTKPARFDLVDFQ